MPESSWGAGRAQLVLAVDVVAEIGVSCTSGDMVGGVAIGELGVGFAVMVEDRDIGVLGVLGGVYFVQFNLGRGEVAAGGFLNRLRHCC